MISVAALWRHPIKSHGREALAFVDLIAGQTMPWDRHWAVIHKDTKFDTTHPEWAMCRNFMIGTSTPDLAGIWAKLDTARGSITLSHQALGQITFAPDDKADRRRLVAWVQDLCPADGRQPQDIVTVPNRGMTDTAYPSISIMNTASHDAVASAMGIALERERWRGNIWLDGLAPWGEWGWIGQNVQIGEAVLRVREPIKRCKHTTAHPHSGRRDADTLAALRDNWKHQNFGLYAEVIQGGKIDLGDTAEVI
uniref:MOSC domain-containing protein n=1 Tax=Yoonia sp. TaxID=2212373 RepID=UPI0040482000